MQPSGNPFEPQSVDPFGTPYAGASAPPSAAPFGHGPRMGAPYGAPPSADYNTFAVLSPIFMTKLFSHYAGGEASIYLPGAPYLVAGVMTFACVLIALKATK